MDNFKTFLEDLASGRPAKKPVSSNLLKQRAKDNEKALKSGFMKMPDYVKKKFNEEIDNTFLDKRAKQLSPAEKHRANQQYKQRARDEIKRRTAEKRKTQSEEKKNCGCGQDPCITYGKKKVSESTRDKYNPKISDVRNKEKMRKVGLPAGKGPLVSEEKQKGIDGKVCWKGYKRMGTKKKGGKTVDNCVKVEDFVLDAFENYYLTELSPKTISSYQKKAGKEYSDLKKSTMSATSREGGYHKGYISQKEYDAQHDMAAKKRQRGKGLAMSKGKGVQKESSSWLQRTADTWNDHADHPHPKVKKHIKAAEKAYNNQDHEGFAHHTNRAADHAYALRQKKKTVKEGAFKRQLTNRQEADRLNDKAHKEAGYKKTSDSGIKKVKGGYERKRTYTREEQMQLVTNLDLDESIANLVRRGVGKVQKAIKDAEKKHGPVDPAKRNIPNPVSGENIAKRLYGKSQKKR